MDTQNETSGEWDGERSLGRFIFTGAIGFGLVSLSVFATVAFAEMWMYTNLGRNGAYLVWTVLFVCLGGAALYPLGQGIHRGWRFYCLFGLAFFAYAVGWVTPYFLLKNLTGEWIGAIAGSVLMALVFALGFRAMPVLPRLIGVLFVANTVGYFLGSMANNSLGKQAGMLSWGLIYGVFLGAGLGATLYLAQTSGAKRGSTGRGIG